MSINVSLGGDGGTYAYRSAKHRVDVLIDAPRLISVQITSDEIVLSYPLENSTDVHTVTIDHSIRIPHVHTHTSQRPTRRHR